MIYITSCNKALFLLSFSLSFSALIHILRSLVWSGPVSFASRSMFDRRSARPRRRAGHAARRRSGGWRATFGCVVPRVKIRPETARRHTV